MSRFVLMVAALLLTPTLSPGQSIQGVWQPIEREVRGGEAPGVESGALIRPSFLFYQGNHYAYLRMLERPSADVLETSTTNAETGAKSILRYRRVE